MFLHISKYHIHIGGILENKIVEVEGMYKPAPTTGVWGQAHPKKNFNEYSEIESGVFFRYFFTHFNVPHAQNFRKRNGCLIVVYSEDSCYLTYMY